MSKIPNVCLRCDKEGSCNIVSDSFETGLRSELVRFYDICAEFEEKKPKHIKQWEKKLDE